MEINIESILNKFGNENKIFQSEAQFQFELAYELQKLYPSYKVSVEVLSASKKINKTQRYYTDIVVSDKEGNYIVIELKYKTIAKDYPEFGIKHLNHGATDLGRFDFLWDLHRIEMLKIRDDTLFKFNRNLKKFINGYAIMLTNEKLYWQKEKTKTEALYKNFCISDNDFIEKGIPLKWYKNRNQFSVDKTSRDIELVFNNNYKFNWKNYSYNKDSSHDFRYILLEV